MRNLIVCFDVDGTLTNADHRIHPADVEVLAGHNDCIFIPSTGRTLSSLRLLFERNGLFVEQPIPFPMILQNGTAIYSQGESLLCYSPFDAKTQQDLLNILAMYPQVNHLLVGLNDIYSLFEFEFGKQIIEQLDFKVVPRLTASVGYTFSKIMILSPKVEPLMAMFTQLASLNVECASSLADVFEITPGGVNKATGLMHLRNKLKLQDAFICAIGDGENDLPILEIANFSFAPQGSHEKVLAIVHQVIDTQKNGILNPILEAMS
jgi:Cof subfamily protein (haloacid dehalogenase superfamily)